MTNLRTDALVARARKLADRVPESAQAHIIRELCDEVLVYRDMAMRLDEVVHDRVKECEI